MNWYHLPSEELVDHGIHRWAPINGCRHVTSYMFRLFWAKHPSKTHILVRQLGLYVYLGTGLPSLSRKETSPNTSWLRAWGDYTQWQIVCVCVWGGGNPRRFFCLSVWKSMNPPLQGCLDPPLCQFDSIASEPLTGPFRWA